MAGLDDDAGDDEPVGPRPAPSDRPWVHPAELQAFTAAPARTTEPPRPREWVIGLVSAGAGVLVTRARARRVRRPGRPRPLADPAPGRHVARIRPSTTRSHSGWPPSAGPSIVTVNADSTAPDGRATRTQGSGVVLRTDRVMTSAHLVSGASKVEVSTKQGDTFTATVIGVDPTTDLCYLLVDGIDPSLPEPRAARRAGGRRRRDRPRRRPRQRGVDEHRRGAGAQLGRLVRQRCAGRPRAARHQHRRRPPRPRAAASSTRTAGSSGSSSRCRAGPATGSRCRSTWRSTSPPSSSATRAPSTARSGWCSGPTRAAVSPAPPSPARCPTVRPPTPTRRSRRTTSSSCVGDTAGPRLAGRGRRGAPAPAHRADRPAVLRGRRTVRVRLQLGTAG